MADGFSSSIVHSMVTWRDGATTLQASASDMRLPIALGAAWPERLDDVEVPLTSSPSQWTFEPVDNETFPAVLGPVLLWVRRPSPRGAQPRTRSWWMPSSTVLCRGWRLSTRCRLSFMSIGASPIRRWRIFWPLGIGPDQRAREYIGERPVEGISERGFDYGYRHHHRYFGRRWLSMRWGICCPRRSSAFWCPDYARWASDLPCGRRRSDTTYALRAILLGGYVKIDAVPCSGSPGHAPRGASAEGDAAPRGSQGGLGREIPQGQEASRAFCSAERTEEKHGHALRSLMNLLICFVLSAVTMKWALARPLRLVRLLRCRNDPDIRRGIQPHGGFEAGVRPGDFGSRVERNADRDLRTVPAGGGCYGGESAIAHGRT